MTVGDRIRARRIELGLSQRELAAQLGYTDHTTLTRIEADKVDLSQSRILQFSKVLGVTPGYLMGWEQEPEDLGALAAKVLKDPALLHFVKKYMTLSDSDRGMLGALVTNALKDSALLQLATDYVMLSDADQVTVSTLVSSLAKKKD